MHVLSIGLNHTTAPVEVRERAAVAAEHLDDALSDISKRDEIEEATIGRWKDCARATRETSQRNRQLLGRPQ